MADKNEEQIIVLEKQPLETIGLIKDLLEADILEVLSETDELYLTDLLDGMWETHGHVKRRGDMETDNNYLQVIPAMAISRGNEYFTYTRLSGGGEKRLHNLTSITVGGHANSVEGAETFSELMLENAQRELEEEVSILDSEGKEITNYDEVMKSLSVKGLIYSDKTEVDALHLAIVYFIDIPKDFDVKVKETDVLSGKFTTKEAIKKLELETWTGNLLRVLK